jgi:CRP-like cAMP-binding protein
MMDVAFLRSLVALRTLDATELEALAHAFTPVEVPAGHVFIREGTRGNTVYLIETGDVAVTRERLGAVEELNHLGPGALFGLVAAVDDELRSATCHAASPVRAGAIDRPTYRALMQTYPRIAFAVQRLVAAQLAADFRNLDRRLRSALRPRDA